MVRTATGVSAYPAFINQTNESNTMPIPIFTSAETEQALASARVPVMDALDALRAEVASLRRLITDYQVANQGDHANLASRVADLAAAAPAAPARAARSRPAPLVPAAAAPAAAAPAAAAPAAAAPAAAGPVDPTRAGTTPASPAPTSVASTSGQETSLSSVAPSNAASSAPIADSLNALNATLSSSATTPSPTSPAAAPVATAPSASTSTPPATTPALPLREQLIREFHQFVTRNSMQAAMAILTTTVPGCPTIRSIPDERLAEVLAAVRNAQVVR